MRKAATGAALTVGALCVCMALALAALALFGGASAKTVAPPAAGPRAADDPQPVSSAVESSSELASSADSGRLGSGSVSGSSVLAESNSGQRTSEGGSERTEPAPADRQSEDGRGPASGSEASESEASESEASGGGSPDGSDDAAAGTRDRGAPGPGGEPTETETVGVPSGSALSEGVPAEEADSEEAHPEEQPPEGSSSQAVPEEETTGEEATEDASGPDGGSGERPSTVAGTDTENPEAENPGAKTASSPSIGSAGTVAKSPAPARPEAPEDKTMRLSVPAMARVQGAEVTNAAHDDRKALDASALHPKGTGFPWERQANVYIAGHRIGYPGTGSFLLFRDLNTLTQGDSVFLTDAMGREYRYEVFEKEVVDPDETSIMDERQGQNIVTLQTCTLPDYTQRLLVRAVKVEGP